MRIALVALVTFLINGCIPLVQYQVVQHKLALETAKRKAIEKRIDACEVREEELKRRPTASKIGPVQLEEIKKQALEEAERGSKGTGQRK